MKKSYKLFFLYEFLYKSGETKYRSPSRTEFIIFTARESSRRPWPAAVAFLSKNYQFLHCGTFIPHCRAARAVKAVLAS